MTRTTYFDFATLPNLAVFVLLVFSLPTTAQAQTSGQQAATSATIIGAEGLDSSNAPVRLADGTRVDGPIRARNGAISIGHKSEVRDVLARNGRIEVGSHSVVRGTIDSRNGRIDLAMGVAVSGDVESRNGRIELGEDVSVEGSVRTRNGRIVLGERSWVGGEIDTRNGAVTLGPGARIVGSARSRNGTVRLEDAWVGRDIDVSAGDVYLIGDSEVEGDLVVLMDANWDRTRLFPFLSRLIPTWRKSSAHAPVVRIGADARVGGRLIVDERARLEIDPGADVPTVERVPNRQALRIR